MSLGITFLLIFLALDQPKNNMLKPKPAPSPSRPKEEVPPASGTHGVRVHASPNRVAKKALFRFRRNKSQVEKDHTGEEKSSSGLFSRIRPIVTSQSSSGDRWECDPKIGEVILKKKVPSNRTNGQSLQDARTPVSSTLNNVIETKRSSSTETNTTEEDQSQSSHVSPLQDSRPRQSDQESVCSQSGVEILPSNHVPQQVRSHDNTVPTDSSGSSSKDEHVVVKRLGDALSSLNGLKAQTRNQRSLDSLASQDNTTYDGTRTTHDGTKSEFTSYKPDHEFTRAVPNKTTNWGHDLMCGLPVCGMYNEGDILLYIEGVHDNDEQVEDKHDGSYYSYSENDDSSSDSGTEYTY